MRLSVPFRYIAWPLALALVVLPVVGLMRGWFAASRWPIRTLEVQAPYKHVSADKLRATVAPYLHKGFFATRLDRVQESVAALPWVASAEARKVWPDTLVLQVHERQPVAHWNGNQLIDRQGRVFTAPGAADITGLPQLSGPESRESDVVAFFQKAYAQFRNDGLVVVGVDLSGRDSWRLELSGGAEIVVGNADPEQRLQRFLDVYPSLGEGADKHFTHVDLRYANGFAVRWSGSQASSPNHGGSPPS